jgi:hypothetical protein
MFAASTAHALNHVQVESKEITGMGQVEISVGVYVTNDVPISSFVCPLELRQLRGDAYLSKDPFMRKNVSGRLAFGNAFETIGEGYTPLSHDCTGPVSHAYAIFQQFWDRVAPDAVFLSRIWVDQVVPIGTDGVPGSGVPSLQILLRTNGLSGCFEIDTCCVIPSEHLGGVNEYGEPVAFSFEKGYICTGRPLPANAVYLDSVSVDAGADSVKVGVYIENLVDLAGIAFPLEFRSVNGAAFVRDFADVQIGGRLSASGLVESVIGPDYYGAPSVDDCEDFGFDSSGGGVGEPLFVSPDGLLWSGYRIDGPVLAPGYDGYPGNGDPSLVICFDVKDAPGRFEIDTCCLAPGNHLSFISADDMSTIVPEFHKGIVIVGLVADSEAESPCTCHTDPVCDGVINVLDVVQAVNVAFRAVTAPIEQSAGCSWTRTDVDCNGTTNVFDVVRFVDVAFRGADAAQSFCNPD